MWEYVWHVPWKRGIKLGGKRVGDDERGKGRPVMRGLRSWKRRCLLLSAESTEEFWSPRVRALRLLCYNHTDSKKLLYNPRRDKGGSSETDKQMDSGWTERKGLQDMLTE